MLRIQMLNSHLKSVRSTLGLMTEVYRIAPAGISITSLDISGQSPSGSFILTGLAEGRAAVLKFASLIRDSSLINKADVNYMRKKRIQSREVISFEIRSSF